MARFQVRHGDSRGALFALLILWLVPKWQVAHLTSLEPRDLFEQENEARKTLAPDCRRYSCSRWPVLHR
jgi:hypothetical protein